MSSLESEHTIVMSGIVTAMKTESEQKLTTTIEGIREDEKKQFVKEMEEMKQHIEEEKAQAVVEAEQNATRIQEQLNMLKDVS